MTIYIGGSEDFSVGCELERLSNGCNLIGKTSILESAAIISKAKLFVGGDSAPLHLASSVEVPVIAFYGPTDSKRHLAASQATIFQKEIPCVPCYRGKCKIKTHDCMREISVDEVFNAVKALLHHP